MENINTEAFINSIYSIAEDNRLSNPELRLGQAIWNAAEEMFKNVSDDDCTDVFQSLRGSSYDPFYNDVRIPAFINAIKNIIAGVDNTN